ncbi:MAG: YfhO family protein, partial [Oscillospiraceae bacterium]|nr:YfhO family protein [Oscillospiraceae bacterium]
MVKIKDKKCLQLNNWLFYTASFAVPVAVMIAAYLANGIFTQWSILINDLSSQYSAFLLYYRNSLAQNGIFYSFSKALGGNFFGIFTYYLTSPLNLLVFLFPSDKIEIPVAIMILLRFGLASVAFNWFVQ